MKQNKQCQLLLLSLAVAACFGSVQANPIAPQVVAGQASFQQQGNVFTVTNTPNTIINWQSFSINQNEITRFLQQGADSKVLNRITGQDPSRILGTLQSNGQVYLINPNGILFGKESRVDVQGLAASSLGLSNADFLAGRNSFAAQGVAGKVENQGSINTARGGQVFLVAPNVENSGIIKAPGGAVMLAAGHSVQLVDASNPSLQVVVSAPADSALNLGEVVAQGGRIGIFGALVNQRGLASADSAVLGENGKVLLRSSGRTMVEGGSRTSARGGEVAILGPQVGVTGNAVVDAGAPAGSAGNGGTVLVGGDYRGANAAVPNSQQVFVGKDAVLSADAGTSGKGGKVIVWADDVARVHGAISARGGAGGGDGGFVETSAYQLETAGLRVDAGAAKGKRGEWLLDPYDIVIKAVPGVPALLGDVATFVSGSPTGVTELATALLSGATADVTLQAKHDITFSDSFTISSPSVGLIAQAGNNINLDAHITTNGGNVSLSANDSASGAASGNGSINISGGISSGVGSIHLNGAGIALTGGATLYGQEVRLTADKMDFASGTSTGAATTIFVAPGTSGAGITLGGSGSGLELSSSTLATLNAQNVEIGSNSGGALNVVGPVDLSASSAGTSILKLAGGSINIGSDLKPKSILYLQADGAISGSGSIAAGTLYASGDSIALNGANQVGSLSAYAEGDISFRNAIALNAGDGIDGLSGVQSDNGSITLEASAITQDYDGSIRTNNTLTLKSSGMIDLSTSYDNHAAQLVANNVGGLNYTESGSVNINSMSLASAVQGGSLVVDASSTLAVSGVVDGSNGVVQLSGGNVALGNSAIVKGKDVRLTARYEGLSTSSGSLVAGSSVTLSSNNMALDGTVQGISSFNPSDGMVTLKNPGGPIQLGGVNQADLSTLQLDASELAKISARKLMIDNSGGEVGGRAITVGDLDISSMALSEALILNSTGAVDLSGTIKLPSAATLIANAAGVINSSAQLTAKAVSLNGDALNFTGGSIVADGGAGGVSLYSGGNVELGGTSATAGFPTFLSTSTLDTISAARMEIGTGAAMRVSGQVGSGVLDLALVAKGGLMTVAGPVLANNVKLEADAMDITGSVTANLAILAPFTPGNSVTIGAACGAGCLSLTQLDKVAAKTLGIGNSDSDGVGSLNVGGAANLNAATTRLGLLSKGAITQSAALSVQELGIEAGGNVVLDDAGNQVGKLAATVYNGDFTFRNAQSLAIARLQGGKSSVETDYDINGVTATGIVTFNVIGSLTSSGALISANKLLATVSEGVGTSASPLVTHVDLLHAESTATSGNSPINITNNQTKPGTLNVLKLKTNTGNAGSITLNNYGETIVPSGGEVLSDSGSISITAHSPLRIDGRVESVSGDISLEAGSSGNASDDLVIGGNALVRTASGNISMTAGSEISFPTANVQAPNGRIAQAANTNTPPVVLPTIDECVANPTQAGCAAVLPPLNQCITTPTAPGCQVVLPPLNQCIATPTAPGCQVVLPSLNQCIATPTAPGCSVVLPPVDQCVANPTAPGCQVVLPTLAQCIATPTAAGCSAVLPSLNQCMANPSAPGCQVVLPPIDQCAANPSAPGCQAVLPSLAQCVASPTLPGCSAVLPSVNSCLANPAAPGCQVVLPSLAQCVAAPSTAGCSAVLPPMSTCVANPAAAGCSAVLPSVSQCVASPAAAGCSAVLPTLAQCIATPTAAGCPAVLPNFSQCVATPTLPGCQAVLPTLAQCVASPSAAGCSAVLPTLSQCTAAPASAGCSAVLPTVDQCAANSTTPGCSVVLPPNADICTIAPDSALCQVLSPPTATQPTKPVQQASDQVIKTINNVVANTGEQDKQSGAPSKTESKEEDKKQDKASTAAVEKTEVKKNEPANKLYCN